ncbi:MAG: Glu-tRNA(Gln) amidotransferase subunit GatE, partial [Thermoplasmata archaeon]|nr:Glu-tRNA(Gln) amidotransferase subunit GatE [Thermoplasmata archaeon]
MKAGLEVHQQLATGKLFCRCPGTLTEQVDRTVLRRLRATGGESAAIDPAVAFEAARGIQFRYETTPSSCLVEADEEPPKELDPAALDVALTVALLLHARPVDEIQVMRKIVIDGSNTSGFQRTSLVATNGWIELKGKRIGIPTVCLEEDAARKVGEGNGESRFRLDRLGIPLVEVATAPEIASGTEAKELADEIGLLLRATRRVRRGIGTIREDLNVSVEGGTRVEIKGVQELRLLPKYVDSERERQETLLHIRDRLVSAHASAPVEPARPLTDLLDGVREGPFRMLGHGGVAWGLRLPGFAGLLRSPENSSERLGRELADYVRTTGVKGLLHSDELPVHGLEGPRLLRVRERLGAEERDGFVVVVAPSVATAEAAIAAARERAQSALLGVPPETRDPLPDGRTRYSRPLPGRDRMYPETDVPPIPVSAERIAQLTAQLPELPSATAARLAQEYPLAPDQVHKLQREDEVERFEQLVREGHPTALVARLLTQDIEAARALAPDSLRVLQLSELQFLLSSVEEGRFAKEGLPQVLAGLLGGAGSAEEALKTSGFTGFTRAQLDDLIAHVIDRNGSLLQARGVEAISPLMGELMAEVRG